VDGKRRVDPRARGRATFHPMNASVGGEVEAWCTTCRIMKDHIIVAVVAGAPAKVECMGCGKQHQYRAQPPGTKPTRAAGGEGAARSPRAPSAAAAARAAAAEEAARANAEMQARIAAADRDAKTYTPKVKFELGQAVRHPTFGVGIVVAHPAPQKMEVAFREGARLLLHDRDAQAAVTLERPAARRDDDGPRSVPDAPARR
jgi:hypothetical protein